MSSDRELNSPKRKTPTPPILLQEVLSEKNISSEPETIEEEAEEELEDENSNTNNNDQEDLQESSVISANSPINFINDNKEDTTPFDTDSIQNEQQENESMDLLDDPQTSETSETLPELNDNNSSNTHDQLGELNENIDHLSQVDDKLFKPNLLQEFAEDKIEESSQDQTQFMPDKIDYEKSENSPQFEIDDNNQSLDKTDINSDEMKEDEQPQYENTLTEIETSLTKEDAERDDSILTEQNELNGSFLPSSLILQQETIVLEKDCSAENCIENVCIEGKFEGNVESDLVLSQLESNFERVRDISDEDVAIEDRFIDAENYVLESGQIPVSISEKNEEKVEDENMHATLFTVARGELIPFSHILSLY